MTSKEGETFQLVHSCFKTYREENTEFLFLTLKNLFVRILHVHGFLSTFLDVISDF